MLDRKAYDLELEKERMKQMDIVLEILSEHMSKMNNIRKMKISGTEEEELIERIKENPLPMEGRDSKKVAEEMIRDVYSGTMQLQHPRFFSFVCSAISPYAIMGSILSDIYNPHGGAYMLAPAAAAIEEKLVDWMGEKAGFPAATRSGIFTSGGSISNMTALIAARDDKLPHEELLSGVAYLSEQTHSSLEKGLKMIGFGADQIVKIPVDDDYRMIPDLLRERIKMDNEAGKKPFLVIGTIATTNTGSIDPLTELADICAEFNLWFHVDGAYGGSVLISDIYRNLCKGVERADSLSWDWHKWMLQPYSCSSVLVRDKQKLLNSFVEHPEYLADVSSLDHNDGWDMGPEMSRPHRCLKLWYTIQSMGISLMQDIVDYSFYNAKIAEKKLLSMEGWEIISKASCGTLNFRYAPADIASEKYDELNALISKKCNEEGFAFIVTTVLREKKVLRMCIINGNTTTDDVLETLEYLDRIAKKAWLNV